MIRVGDRAKDVVTGYEGIVVGITRWITGCDSAGVQRLKDDKTGTIELWFDVNRLIVTEAAAVSLEPATSQRPRVPPASDAAGWPVGGPQPTPQQGNRQ